MKKLLLFLAALLAIGDVMAQCTAGFTSAYSPYQNDVFRYQFNNTSTTGAWFSGKAVYTSIAYGDGSGGQFFSWSPSVFHNYAAAGTYNLTQVVVVYDSATSTVICTDTARTSLTVAAKPCAFTIASTKVNDSTYTYTATNVNSIASSYLWNFGDGTTGSGSSVTHTFPASGSYNVSAVDSSSTCVYTNWLWQNVLFVGPFSCDSLKPWIAASVVARNVYVNPGYQTNFNFNYPGKAVKFMFDYNDGSPVTASNTHAYSATGTYNIRAFVTVTDSPATTVYCRDTLTRSVTIFYLYSDIYAHVSYDSLTYSSVNTIKAWLISHDTAAGTLTAVDSMTGVGAGNRSLVFRSVQPGRYLIKAAVTSAATGTGLLPTYSDSSLLWSGARYYNHDGVNGIWNAPIFMRTGTVTSGPGFVGGSVSLGANKGTSSGAPGVSMILYNASNKMVAMTETDAQGNYSFRDIPVGTYVVMPELLSYDAASSVPFSITASSATVNGISFFKDDTKMSIRAANVGVEKTAVSMLSVSPNPARNSVRIVADSKAALELELRDLSGKVVHRASMAAGSVMNLDVRSYTPGLYFLHTGSGAPVKLVIE